MHWKPDQITEAVKNMVIQSQQEENKVGFLPDNNLNKNVVKMWPNQ